MEWSKKAVKIHEIKQYDSVIANKFAMWTKGIVCLGLPQVFPCLELVIVFSNNYDEDRKKIGNQNA